MKTALSLDKCVSQFHLLSKQIETYFGIIGDPIEIFAMYEARKRMCLKFNNKRNIPGYDAIDEKGHKVEIKGGRVRNKNYGYCSVFKNWKNKLDKFDYAVLVSFDHKLNVKFILKISAGLIKNYFKKQSNSISISHRLVKEEIRNKNNFNFFYVSEDIDIYEIIKGMTNKGKNSEGAI